MSFLLSLWNIWCRPPGTDPADYLFCAPPLLPKSHLALNNVAPELSGVRSKERSCAFAAAAAAAAVFGSSAAGVD